jgi:uncharacterized protein (TIGR00159 family)
MLFDRLSAALHLPELLNYWSLLDIAVLAIIIYQLLLLVRGTRAVQMVVGVVAVVVAHIITRPGLLHLPAVHSVLGNLLLYIPFAIIVLFQNNIRQALMHVGRNPLSALFPRRGYDTIAEEVALAATALASRRLGALIVLERNIGLRAHTQTGIRLEAVVSYDLLMNIFSPGTPLHDGAVVIADGRVKAASCYLPLTMDPGLSRVYGTRHRAAIGITEESDAMAVVVSEERGVVSLADGGKILEDLDAPGLEEKLLAVLSQRTEGRNEHAGGKSLAAARTRDA